MELKRYINAIACIAAIGFGNYSAAQPPRMVDPGSITAFLSVGPDRGYGSGFYAADSAEKYLYLITAAHVLVDTGGNIKQPFIIASSYRQNSLTDARDSFLIDLKGAYTAKLFKYDIPKDVAVLQIAKSTNGAIQYENFCARLTKSNTRINQISLAQAQKMNSLNAFDEVYTMGYPVSLSYERIFDKLRPLARHGIVSGMNYDKSKIITDLPAYHGNSGGIVYVKRPLAKGGYQYVLVGLMSALIPLDEKWQSSVYQFVNHSVYNSGYSVVASADAILEQVALIGK